MKKIDRHDVQQVITCIVSGYAQYGTGGYSKPETLAAVMGWPVSRIYECVILSQGRIRETPAGLTLAETKEQQAS